MGNRLSQPYCEFDFAEWENKIGVPTAFGQDIDSDSPALLCHYSDHSDDPCQLHQDVTETSIDEISNILLEHFQQSTSDPRLQRHYNTIVGVEVPGLKFDGRALRANHENEIDIIHMIAHDEVSISGSDVVSKIGFRSSLFEGEFKARKVAFFKRAVFNHSQFESDADFRKTLFDQSVSFLNSTIHGDLNLSEVTVKGDLDLREATIHGNVRLHGATINGDLKLDNTNIDGDLDLEYGTVKGSVRASGTNTGNITLFSTHIVGSWISNGHTIKSIEWGDSQFDSGVYIYDSTIQESLQGTRVTIEGSHRWKETSVGGSVKFINSQFNHITSFRGVEIGEDFNIRQTDMKHHFLLVNVDVTENAEMSGTELGSYTLLSHVDIGEDLISGSANADGILRYYNVTVGGQTNLEDLAVGEHLQLRSCEFEGDVNLAKSVVKEYVQIYDTIFKSNLYASNSRVGRYFEIKECTSSAEINLKSTQIGDLSFDKKTDTKSLILDKVHVTERVATLEGITVRELLSLDKTSFRQGIKLESVSAGEVSMKKAEVGGNLNGKDLSVGTFSEGGSFVASDTQILGEFQMEEATIYGKLDLQSAYAESSMNIDGLRVKDIFSLSNAYIGSNLKGNGTDIGHLNITGTTFAGGVILHRADIRGNIDGSQLKSNGSNITFSHSTIQGAVSFGSADLAGDLIVTNCNLKGSKTDGSLPLDRAPEEVSEDTPEVSFNTSSASISGDFLIENGYIRKTVYATGTKVRTVELDETTVTGSYYIEESEIRETLTVTGSNIFHRFKAEDLRLGSKCEIYDLSAMIVDFSESLFKWNVTISECLVGSLTLENATFRNKLRLEEVMAYNGDIQLNNSRVTNLSIEWGRGSTAVECKRAKIGNLDTKEPDGEYLWTRLKINRTQFDGLDFADLTESLSQTNYLIHPDDQQNRMSRYRSFLPTFLKHIRQYRRRDLDDLTGDYEDREVTYRRAKDSADKTGDNPAASKFYKHEKKYRRRRRFWGVFSNTENRTRNLAAWATNLGLGILAGHGERATQVVGSAATAIVIFGFIIYTIPVFDPNGATYQLTTALEQSLRTFVGASPTIKQSDMPIFVEQILLLERALGIAFIPLLVFALTRSLHR